MEERLKELRKALNINQADFSKRLNLGQSTWAMIEVGKRNINDRHIISICREFNVNEQWLRNGTGEMFLETTDITLDDYVQLKDAEPLEIEVFKTYLELPRDIRTKIMEHFKGKFGYTEIATTKEESSIEDELTATQEDYISSELEEYRLALEAQAKAQKSEALNSTKSKNMA